MMWGNPGTVLSRDPALYQIWTPGPLDSYPALKWASCAYSKITDSAADMRRQP